MMKQEELNEILRLHKLWLDNEDGGENANLRGADLTDADLRHANLRGANLRGANLSGTKADYNTAGYFQSCPEGEIVGYKNVEMTLS